MARLPVAVGNHVELHPATDRWMMGDQWGVVKAMDPAKGQLPATVRITMDKSGKTITVARKDVLPEE